MGTLLYDPDCGFCTRASGWVSGLGAACHVVPGTPAALAAHGVDPERARRELPFVDDLGTVTWGSDAVASALSTGTPLARFAAALLRAPVLRGVAHRTYRLVARHRQRLPGGTAACALPAARPAPTEHPGS